MKKNVFKIRVLLILFSAVLLISSIANAFTNINDPYNGEKNLYQIFNDTFDQNLSSSDQLYQLYGLSDAGDDWWDVSGTYGSVKFTVRYAGYGQELGIYTNGGYQPIVANIQWYQSAMLETIISVNTEFAFAEKANGNYFWYSADMLNPIQDGVDHFHAFNVTKLYNLKFNDNANRAWLIAFEDLSGGGDRDYNDLVALVVDVQPTVIALSSFTALPSNNRVILKWATESEIDNIGFNIYRAESRDGIYVRVNDDPIPAKGSSVAGATYEFIDKNAKNRKAYHYKLEDIDLSGKTTIHGPVNTTPRWILGIWQ